MVEFIEDGHMYINSKGVIIPSVSELVSFAFPNSYKGIDKEVLKKKAEYGTKVHEMLEKFDDGKIWLEQLNFSQEDPNIKSAVRQYDTLKKKYMIHPKSQEVIVDFEERYAGRYDKLDIDNVLWDVKTTYKKKVKEWECQLGLYYMALGLNKDIGYVIWLPKQEKGEVILITPWTRERCLKLLEDYEKTK